MTPIWTFGKLLLETGLEASRFINPFNYLWCILHQRDWLNLSDACLVGKHHMSPHALAVINLKSKSQESEA